MLFVAADILFFSVCFFFRFFVRLFLALHLCAFSGVTSAVFLFSLLLLLSCCCSLALALLLVTFGFRVCSGGELFRVYLGFDFRV